MNKLKPFLHKAFIPGRHNSWRPLVFQHHLLLLYYVGFLISHFHFGIALHSDISPDPEALRKSIITSINSERAKNSLGTLNENAMLTFAAKQKLKDMFGKNYWDHTSPTGDKAWKFIENSGYTYEAAGENLARGFITADGMINAWMKSPTHRENILNKEYLDTGIAVGNGKIDGRNVTVAVQLFGSPKTALAQSGPSLVAGEKSVIPRFDLQNPTKNERMPFFYIYLALLALVIFDGIMIRVNKTHKNKKHMFAFRASLAMSFVALAVLTLSLSYIS